MAKFIDQVTIEVKAGNGGNGCISFRREKFIPRGGPNGGDGGNGGSVIFDVDHNLSTLLDYRYQRHHKAENGKPGEGSLKSGKSGSDLVLKVPPGTMVFDDDSGDLLFDLIEAGKEVIAAQGGSGGWGNDHFKSSINQAPRRANPGTPGEEIKIRLELKLMADVGLVGFPNAGKSTLISRISAAKPKIADYPFTTLVPNLGVVRYGDEGSYVVADIPGLIEGAADGKGLGHDFLRHVERTRVIVHLIDPAAMGEGRNPVSDYETINRELARFSKNLAEKEQIVILNKRDIFSSDDEVETFIKELEEKAGVTVIPISSVTGSGVGEFTNLIGLKVEESKRKTVD